MVNASHLGKGHSYSLGESINVSVQPFLENHIVLAITMFKEHTNSPSSSIYRKSSPKYSGSSVPRFI